MGDFKITMRAARINHDLSASEIANELGISEQTVRVWERNPQIVRKIYRERLCDIYGISEDHIDFSRGNTLPTSR